MNPRFCGVVASRGMRPPSHRLGIYGGCLGDAISMSDVLDYSIRDHLAPFISPMFYGWTDRGGSSSMVPELKSWVQFLSTTHFLLLRVIIPTYLVVC
jgi:hypothetical protein